MRLHRIAHLRPHHERRRISAVGVAQRRIIEAAKRGVAQRGRASNCFTTGITHPCWITLAVLGQLDYALGDHNRGQCDQLGARPARYPRTQKRSRSQYRPDRHDVPRNPQRPHVSLAQMARGVCLIGDSLSAPGDCRGADGRCADAAGIARPCRHRRPASLRRSCLRARRNRLFWRPLAA